MYFHVTHHNCMIDDTDVRFIEQVSFNTQHIQFYALCNYPKYTSSLYTVCVWRIKPKK